MDSLNSARYGAVYDRLLRQNAFVRWAHIFLCLTAAVCYQIHHNPSHYAFWRSTGWAIIATLTVPIWPYALSCAAIWRRSTTDWWRPWVFCFGMLVITLLVCLWYSTESSHQTGLIANLTVTMFQSSGYHYLAQWTYEDSFDEI